MPQPPRTWWADDAMCRGTKACTSCEFTYPMAGLFREHAGPRPLQHEAPDENGASGPRDPPRIAKCRNPLQRITAINTVMHKETPGESAHD